ncbi:hypothetical protein FB45DRAFT_1152650 [Roridomyces roridus]|uniref:Uncharacterized protein n=1 Tax=Roridomyces roridus TaxID=1738132 RepID=A0AAD7BUI2_9AGAR|nr:hypothetical protein FB45DRAFT_1152650 [Roridomyces roridus]
MAFCRHLNVFFQDIQLEDEAEYTDEVANPDRLSQPARGSTPLLDDERYEYPPEYISSESRRAEYEQLRRRGASRLMCLTFNLEYDSDVGIIAWADGEIYDAFSGPLMQQGDFWKFLLGRRIELDEDDPDGSGFIEGLLEGALPDSQWETVEESPGIWVTKAVDYGSESSSDEDESMSQSEAAGTTPKTYPGTLSWIQGQTPEEQDALLEPDYVPPAHPVQACSYEASDEDEDELDDDMSVDEWDPTMPDRAWGESEDDEQEEATESELEIKVEDALMALSVSDDDSADSDFDEEDQFSGDEIVLGLQA